MNSQTLVQDMIHAIDDGVPVIMNEFGVSESVAILAAFRYACEHLTDTDPELVAQCIAALKLGSA